MLSAVTVLALRLIPTPWLPGCVAGLPLSQKSSPWYFLVPVGLSCQYVLNCHRSQSLDTQDSWTQDCAEHGNLAFLRSSFIFNETLIDFILDWCPGENENVQAHSKKLDTERRMWVSYYPAMSLLWSKLSPTFYYKRDNNAIIINPTKSNDIFDDPV